jgi:hypothetical protein
MGREHCYRATITWTGNLGEGNAGYRSYSRDHEVSGNGKPMLPGSSDPGLARGPERWNPEELLVAAHRHPAQRRQEALRQPVSSPHSYRSSSRSASLASVLWPFSALACAGLITITSVKPSPARA